MKKKIIILLVIAVFIISAVVCVVLLKNDRNKKSDTSTDNNIETTSELTNEDPENENEDLESDEPFYVIDTVEASSGANDVTVNIRIKNNPGVIGTSFILHYDESALQLKKAESGEAFSELNHTAPKKLNDGCVFTWYGDTMAEEDICDGTVLSLHFKVLKSASEGSYPIEISGFTGNTYDTDLSEVSLDINNGAIIIR